jgi:hypothetical protein
MHWNILSVNLGANPLHNFGIQHPVNPQLSPTFWMGSVVSADIRIPVQAAFQAAVLFLIMLQICRNAGARLDDASAISLIAVYYCFVPQLSNGAVMEDALFGLLWQEGAIATLIAFWCFALIGYGKVSKQRTALLFVTLMAAVLWLILAYPELVTFFILATTGLCAGPLLSAQSRRELLYKSAAAVTLIAALLLLRVDAYVLNLFLYTPQMYYANTFTPDFTGYFMTTTSVLNRWLPRGWEGAPLVVFVGLAILGGYFALHFGSSFARRVVFAAISLEAVIFLFGAINMLFKLAPLNLYYAEQMGLTVAALLAGTGAWGLLQLVLDKVLRTWSSPNAIEGDTARPWSLVVLMLLVGSLFYVLSGPNGVVNGWPPATDSIPAQIQSKELAIKPGDNFKGRGVILVAMQKTAPAKWLDAYNVHYYKFRVGLGNDLMNDAEIAGIPIVNEYGHWMSPPMLALLSVAFYRPEDHIDRAAQAPRAFRSNLARAMGVSFALTDSELPQEVEIYRGSALDHPLYMYRIVGANVGDFSPTKMIYASNAAQIVDHLQAPDFDGRKVAIAEEQIAGNLVQAESVVVSLHKGPRLHVEAHSSGTSLLVLPFEFSYCLDVQGTGLDRLIPINLAQIGLIIRGSALLDISYRYGLISGTSCRNEDRRRIDKLRLAEIAPGRLFYSPRAADRN